MRVDPALIVIGAEHTDAAHAAVVIKTNVAREVRMLVALERCIIIHLDTSGAPRPSAWKTLGDVG